MAPVRRTLVAVCKGVGLSAIAKREDEEEEISSTGPSVSPIGDCGDGGSGSSASHGRKMAASGDGRREMKMRGEWKGKRGE